MPTRHDLEVARIVRIYPDVGAKGCAWCEGPISLTSADSIVSERTLVLDGIRIVPDVTAKDVNGNPLVLIEVVDTHAPRQEALDVLLGSSVQTVIVSIKKGQRRLMYCSVFCWVHQADERVSMLETCTCCDTLDFSDGRYRDWSDDPHDAFCLWCAASRGGQWSGPMGETDLFATEASLATRFCQWEIARFWSMVWDERALAADGNREMRDESRTTRQLDLIESAFVKDNWLRASQLLMPIGSGWTPGDRGESDEQLELGDNYAPSCWTDCQRGFRRSSRCEKHRATRTNGALDAVVSISMSRTLPANSSTATDHHEATKPTERSLGESVILLSLWGWGLAIRTGPSNT